MKSLADLRALLDRATPPPWRWYGNTRTKHLQIATVGHGICTVMGFERWGMGGAAPNFAVGRDTTRGDWWGGRLTRADELARYEVLGGRTIAEARKEPYRYDVVGIDHPDAELIVEAVNALPVLLDWIERHGAHPHDCAIWVELDDVSAALHPDVSAALHPVGTCDCGLSEILGHRTERVVV